MTHPTSPILPENWQRDVLACKAVQHGQIVRRKTRDMKRFAGMDGFIDEVRRRGFRAVENRGAVHRVLQHGTRPARDLTVPIRNIVTDTKIFSGFLIEFFERIRRGPLFPMTVSQPIFHVFPRGLWT